MTEVKFPRFLINPEERVDPADPKSALKATRGGPLVTRWYRDPAYRIWEESKDITARWKLSQRLAPKVQAWLRANGITAYVEFKAAGWRDDAAARKAFDAFLLPRRNPGQPLMAKILATPGGTFADPSTTGTPAKETPSE